MKIVFFVLDAGWFGHTRTACSVIKRFMLEGSSAHVVFDVSRNENFIYQTLKSLKNIKFYAIKQSGERYSVSSFLRENELHDADLIHSFEGCGIFEIIQAADKFKVKHVSTVCSPIKAHNYFPARNTVFLSEEFRKQSSEMTQVVKNCDVIRARIDSSYILSPNPMEEQLKEWTENELNMGEGDILIVRVCQASKKYLPGLRSILASLTEMDSSDAGKFRFLHVGDGSEAEIEELASDMKKLNERHGKVVALTTKHGFENAHIYLRFAKVVIGSGRSAFEAMGLGKLCVITDMSGTDETLIVSEATIDHIEYYNFSGRSNSTHSYSKKFSEQLKLILLEDPIVNKSIQFSRAYFQNNLCDSLLFKRYMRFYEASNVANYSRGYWLLYGAKDIALRAVRRFRRRLIRG